jgi:competence protein ComEC
VGAAAGCLGVALAASRRARRALPLAALCLTATEHGRGGPEEVHLAVLDVGQGDAILVRSRRHAVLIDGGGAVGRDLAVAALLPALAAHGVARLDAVALSHFDMDHCAGLLDLAGSVPVRSLWLPATAAGTPCSREVVGAFGARPRELAAGDGITLGELRFTVLHPDRSVPLRAGNAPSLVLRLDALGRRALLTGDLDGAAERELASRYGESLACDLLKVAHHGSSRSSGPELLAAVRPRLAIVSAGVRNAYGHPSDGALDRLRRCGARILRTDRDGGVEVWWRAGEPWRIALPGSPRRTVARR